ncbi:MAG: hypothetical protein IMZ58_00195 [Thermoplasmata archaeon]|nr:hypothetical protein [Thermoplasmata archaeon]
MREISKARLRRYKTMRLLFRCDKDFDELQREAEVSKIELINVLQYLQHYRLVKKIMKETGTAFSLTERGESRLAYFEFEYKIFRMWRPKYCQGTGNGWENDYREEIAELMKKLDYFGKDYVLFG